MARVLAASRPLIALSMALALSLAVVAGLSTTPVSADDTQVFTPPFELGPQAGDMWNIIDANGDEGSITMLRVYPDPGRVASCPGKSGMATFRVETDALRAEEVTATFPDAVMDGYTFITLSVKDTAGEYLGAREIRGPLLEGGSLTVPLPEPPDDATERQVTIDVGMKVASACPNVDGGTVTFSQIEVS